MKDAIYLIGHSRLYNECVFVGDNNSGMISAQNIYNMRNGIPIADLPSIDIPNDHLQYLVTWQVVIISLPRNITLIYHHHLRNIHTKRCC